MSPALIGVIILIVSIVLYITEVIPMAVTAMFSAVLMGVFGAVNLSTCFAGFSTYAVMMNLGMLFVGEALFMTGAAEYLGKRLSHLFGRTPKSFLVSCVLVTAVISAFLNNAASVALMLPIAGSIVAASNGTLLKKDVYMAIGFAGVAGGGMTLVGTTSQIVAQGFLTDAGLEPTSFSEWFVTGAPKVILIILFFVTFGGPLLRKVCDFPEVPNESSVDVDNLHFTWQMGVSILVLVGCIIGYILQVWNIGIVSMLATAVLLATKAVDYKTIMKRLDWNTFLIVAFVLSFASCLNESGSGVLLADTLVGLLGSNVNPVLMLIVVALLSAFLGNCISATATVSIMAPICMYLAPAVGMNPRSLVIATAVFGTLNYSTPTSTPPNTMPLVAGYRYRDYVKVGGLLNLISVAVVLVVFAMFYPLSA